MIVRPLTAADAAALQVIRLEMLTLHPGAYGSTLANWADLPLEAYAARIESCVLFGLWTDAGLQGTLAYDREAGGNARHRAGIHAVYVRAALRGSGAIDALMQAAIAQARVDGLAQLELTVSADNAPAVAAYARLGFVQVAVWPRALCVAGRFVDEVVMVLALDG